MSRAGSASRWLLAILLLAPAGAAQQQLPRPNPLQGLRGAPSRGVATRGTPTRGITTRPMTPRVPLVTNLEVADREGDAKAAAAGSRRGRAGAGRGVLPRRAAALLAQGRQAEALEILEDALAEQADDAEALALLEDLEAPGDLPADPLAALEELLDRGSGASRTRRELVVLQLRELGVRHRNELELALRTSLLSPSADRRLFATHALRRLFPGRASALLVRRALLDGTPEVRASAAWALGVRRDRTVTATLGAALSGASERVRLHAAQALGQLGDPSAVEALVARLQVLQAAGDAGHAAELRAVRHALQRLTGVSVNDDAQAWLRWWRAKGPAWLAGQPPSR